MTVTAAECPVCGATNVFGPSDAWTHCSGCGLIVQKPIPTTTKEKPNP